MRTATILFLLALGGCQTGGAGEPARGQPGQASDGFPAPSKEAVYEVALASLRGQGFVPDPEFSDPVAGRLESRWKVSLQPFAGSGRRDRASVRIDEVKARPGTYRVDTNVTRQNNDNISQPGSLGAAEWSSAYRVPELELLINRRIEYYFLGPAVSDQFRSNYGMGADPHPARLPSSGEGAAPVAPPPMGAR